MPRHGPVENVAPRAVRPASLRSAEPTEPGLLALQRTAGNRAVAALAGRQPRRALHRYQQGEMGHGGIEEEALRAAGLTGSMGGGEIGGIYLGNWMRDFSQVGDAHKPYVLNILNVLSMGEFNRQVTAEQIGGYLPSEHLDKPTGGDTVEDPTAKKPDATALSTAQKAWVAEEASPKFKTAMSTAAKASHIPEYIEAGKELARRNLTAAATNPRGTPESSLPMGAGLHAIEDYYAHSNFTDAAVYLLAAEGKLPPTSKVFADLKARAASFGYDPSGGVAGGAKVPEIMTGTYRKSGNSTVSLLEALRSEVQTGALRRAAILGAIRLGIVKGAAEGRAEGSAAGGVVGGVLGGASGIVPGAIGGAASGAAAGWSSGSGLGAVAGAVGGLFSGAATGVADGASHGYAAGSSLGSAVGGTVGAGVGAAEGALAGASVGAVVALISAAIETERANPLLAAAADKAADAASDAQTRKATAADKVAKDTSPNHSELAKDATDHPVYSASRALAVHVDAEIGKAMVAAWGAGGSPASVAAVTALVDEFVCNPADKTWWRGVLLSDPKLLA